MARIDDVDCLLARWFVFLVCYLPPPYPRLIAPGVCMVALPSKQTVTESAHLNKFVYSFPAPDDVFPFIFSAAAASDCGCCFFGRFTEHHLLLRLLLLLQVCFRCKYFPRVFIASPFGSAVIRPASQSCPSSLFLHKCGSVVGEDLHFLLRSQKSTARLFDLRSVGFRLFGPLC